MTKISKSGQGQHSVSLLTEPARCVRILYCVLYTVRGSGAAPKLFIHRPAVLSAICLSWLERIWNLGEGGPLCMKHACQQSIFCTGSDHSTEYTVLAGCFVHNGPPSPKFQISLSISSLGLSSLYSHPLLANCCLSKSGVLCVQCTPRPVHTTQHIHVRIIPAGFKTLKSLAVFLWPECEPPL
jgi:hypothetical protein